MTRPFAEPTNDASSTEDAPAETNLQAVSSRLNEAKPGTAEYSALTAEQKDTKKLAKRILKAVKDPLEDATRKEAELRGRDQEEMIRKLDEMGLFASALKDDASPVKKTNGKRKATEEVEEQAVEGASPDGGDVEMEDVAVDADESADADGGEEGMHISSNGNGRLPSPRKRSTTSSDAGSKRGAKGKSAATEPLSPPPSTSPASAANAHPDPSDFLAAGGIPWYLETFDPHGTTVHEERYTGREVLRGMSEELSDMDEDTLTELHAESGEMGKEGPAKDGGAEAGSKSVAKKKPKRKGRRSVWEKRRR